MRFPQLNVTPIQANLQFTVHITRVAGFSIPMATARQAAIIIVEYVLPCLKNCSLWKACSKKLALLSIFLSFLDKLNCFLFQLLQLLLQSEQFSLTHPLFVCLCLCDVTTTSQQTKTVGLVDQTSLSHYCNIMRNWWSFDWQRQTLAEYCRRMKTNRKLRIWTLTKVMRPTRSLRQEPKNSTAEAIWNDSTSLLNFGVFISYLWNVPF